MQPTHNTLSENIRAQSVELLNKHLAAAIDLHAQVKQAHWNVRGPGFIAVHELFDKVSEEVENYSDLIAERAGGLGGAAYGTVQVAAKNSFLVPYALDIADETEDVFAISGALAAFGQSVREAIDQATTFGDVDTADLFTEISRGVDSSFGWSSLILRRKNEAFHPFLRRPLKSSRVAFRWETTMQRVSVTAIATLLSLAAPASAAPVDWPSYNRTLTSERFAPIAGLNAATVTGLKVICTYDTKELTGFQTGLLQVNGALYGTTENDTFSINPDTCKENWRAHEDFASSMLKVNRGAAYLDGKIFRGASDGRVLAYDAATGKQLWATTIADPKRGETVPASPIAWKGLVFIGNAGGDNKGVKGRMYALDATNGKIVWEFYLVPRGPSDVARGPAAPGAPAGFEASWETAAGFSINGGGVWTSFTLDTSTGLLYVPGGNPAPDFVPDYRNGDNLLTGSVVVLDAKTGAYKRHFQLVKRDFHDWDVSTAPALFTTKAGRRIMAVAPKDGHLYGIDLASGAQLYRLPMTTVANAEAPLTPEGVRFCPGSQGGAEWNGPAYDPLNDTILTGEVDWCATVRTDPKDKILSMPEGQPWSGSADGFGKMDDTSAWAGWLTASDATTGARKWRFKAPFPLMSGVTPTAGGLVFFGDMGGNFYAFDSAAGKNLWSQNLGGAVAGGVITYDTGAGQKVAVAVGMTSPLWPTLQVTGRIVVFGLQ